VAAFFINQSLAEGVMQQSHCRHQTSSENPPYTIYFSQTPSVVKHCQKASNRTLAMPVKPSKPPSSLHCLTDLKHIKHAIAQQTAARKLAAQKHAEQQAVTLKSARLFVDAVGAVVPIKLSNTVVFANTYPAPVAVQRTMDEAQVMRDSLSDDFGVEQLLETDTDLSYRTAGISLEILNKLRRGDWTMQAELDLHGFRVDEARRALTQFLHIANERGWRCVRIVHGKGLGSKDKQPILKGRVRSWLAQTKTVQCFVAARPSEGGAGALVVLLASS
jgi:DNA-nicking Smr family endonuclease